MNAQPPPQVTRVQPPPNTLADDQRNREPELTPQYPERRWLTACLLGLLIPLVVEISLPVGLLLALPIMLVVGRVQGRMLQLRDSSAWLVANVVGGVHGLVILFVASIAIWFGSSVCGQVGTALAVAVVGGFIAALTGFFQFLALERIAPSSARAWLWMTVLSWTMLLFVLVMVTPGLWRNHCGFVE